MSKRQESVDYKIKATWHAIARMYNAEAAKYNSTIAIGYILLNIDMENGTPATKIAPLLGLEARSITRTLKNMEQDGYIYKVQDEKDKRFFRIFLTEKGIERRALSKQFVKKFNQAVKEAVPEEELAVFFKVINKINQVIENENKSANTVEEAQMEEII